MVKMSAFIDSHCHFLGMGYSSTLIPLQDVKSMKELLDQLKKQPNQSIIIARGWNQENLLEKRVPELSDLDQVSKEVPMVLIRTCGHVVVVNSKMLSIMNLNGKSLDSSSIPSKGYFVEEDIHFVYDHIPKPTKEDLIHYLTIADEICLRNGITKVASDDFCIFDIPYEDVIEAILESQQSGKVHVSITEQVNLPSIDTLKDFIKKGYPNKRYPKFKMGPLKLLADGSLGGRTAALHHPYSDDLTNRGILNFSDEELINLIRTADNAGMDSAIHAIGDRAVDQVLSAFIEVISTSKRVAHNHAIIHAQIVDFRQISVMKEHHIGAIVQPIFLNSDLSMIQNRLGNRIFETYLFHSMKIMGIEVGFSTDSPVENINPFENLFVSMTRTSLIHPNLDPHLVNESFSIDEALYCYRTGNLRYIYETEMNDFIIVDKHPNSVEVRQIPFIKVLQTIIDGQVVYNQLDQ